MFLFVDGNPVILTFEQVEDLYYKAFINEFDDISKTQWRGSYEYQCLYPAIQYSSEIGAITQSAVDFILASSATLNSTLKMPAVLHSRVSVRFKEEGYIATIRRADINTRGIVAICVDYIQDATKDAFIAKLIAVEMLPAGQFMEGSIAYAYTFSNGQQFDIKWSLPIKIPIEFRITLTRDRNSVAPIDTVDVIHARFLDNFNKQAQLGVDIKPDAYYQIERDAPWASLILTEYSLDAGNTWNNTIIHASYKDKYIGDLPKSNVIII